MTDLLTDADRVARLMRYQGLHSHLGAMILEAGGRDRDAMLRTLEGASDRQLDALNELYRASLVGRAATARASLWAMYADVTAALRLEALVQRLNDALGRVQAWAARHR